MTDRRIAHVLFGVEARIAEWSGPAMLPRPAAIKNRNVVISLSEMIALAFLARSPIKLRES
jgi:hypothetical protein